MKNFPSFCAKTELSRKRLCLPARAEPTTECLNLGQTERGGGGRPWVPLPCLICKWILSTDTDTQKKRREKTVFWSSTKKEKLPWLLCQLEGGWLEGGAVFIFGTSFCLGKMDGKFYFPCFLFPLKFFFFFSGLNFEFNEALSKYLHKAPPISWGFFVYKSIFPPLPPFPSPVFVPPNCKFETQGHYFSSRALTIDKHMH